MEPITAAVLAATVLPLASGAAGEAGRQAWTSLVDFLRTRFARDEAPAQADALAQRPDPAHGQRLATRLVDLAGRDSEFAEWLQGWFRTAAPLAGQHGSVVNQVGDHAQVNGGLIQAHTIEGSVTFN